jgi:hypothetical protein
MVKVMGPIDFGRRPGADMADADNQLDLFGGGEPATDDGAKRGLPAIDQARAAKRMGLKQRQLQAQLMGVDPFQYLLVRFSGSEESAEKDELAFQLMPYLKPKLRAVELKGDGGGAVAFQVTIGGDE